MYTLFATSWNYLCAFLYVITPADVYDFWQEPADIMILDRMLNGIYYLFMYVIHKLIQLLEIVSNIHAIAQSEFYR